MSAALRHPTVEAVIAIHAQVLAAHGGATGIRSRELLESAIATPQATMMGQSMMADPIEIAAAYFFYLCSNHPFVDGNKRMALATCLIFLSENGLLANETLEVDAWESLTLNIAAGLLTRDEITEALRNLLT
ncbi:MAG: type II toxin-antitoxin system death-on-curing family toxin [Akkermansiaceae bacterium]|nr:type II toxin-antitoxin system death-on-curing family toxin [Akkermansiaceae bacterium]